MTGVGSVSSEAWDRKSLRWMSLQSTLRSGRVYKKMERYQDGAGAMAQMLQLNRMPEDPEEGDGNEEENGGEQHGGANGAGAMAQMLQLNGVPEDPEEGDGNEEENGGEQHGGADGAGAMAQMLHSTNAIKQKVIKPQPTRKQPKQYYVTVLSSILFKSNPSQILITRSQESCIDFWHVLKTSV